MKNKLKELRQRKKLSQKEFAAAFNKFLKDSDSPIKDNHGNIKKISYATVSRWENGQTPIPSIYYSSLAGFFQVPVPYLQGFEQARDRNRTDYRYFIEADGSKYYGADELIFKNLGGQWFLVGYSTAGCRTLINTAKIVAIEEMYKDKDKQND